MQRREQAKPRWVLIAGELREVSTFVGLSPTARPLARCPVCDEQVTLKLGERRVPHYAHRPNSTCPATSPETALHLNVKFYLAAQVRAAKRLWVQQWCWARCGATNEHTWAESWDAVEVEYTVAGRRPDIALLQDGATIGAVEIVVSHAVDAAKREELAAAGIRWVEVQAEEVPISGKAAWTPEQPFPLWRSGPVVKPWICPACAARRVAAPTPLVIAPLPPPPEPTEHIYAAKMVDLYYPSGKKYRKVFYVIERRVGGDGVECVLRTETGTTLASQHGPMTQMGLAYLNGVVKAQLRQKRDQEKALVDGGFCITPPKP